jgi:hypothetical protein
MNKQLSLVCLIFGLFVSHSFAQEQCLQNAWNSFNSQRYEDAINYCNQCIEDFGKKALRTQKLLDSLKIIPSIGNVNDVEKNKIFKNGLLNDVSTACFIKGKSAESLYKQNRVRNHSYKKLATDAYKLACKYNKGRCFDPKGYFWSPCEASSERLPVN